MTSLPPDALARLAARFHRPGVRAVMLMGSEARGDAGPDSDVDVVRLLAAGAAPLPDRGSHLIYGRLVVVSELEPQEVERWFAQPERAVEVLAGLRSARALVDPEALVAALQRRAAAFTWDTELQEQANRWASRELTGWAEEALKGIEGLRRPHVGRLLNARHLAWGLTRVLAVQRGILLSGDNAFYDETAQAAGTDSAWVAVRRLAFGIEDSGGVAPVLAEQVAAALRLYLLTVELLTPALQPDDQPVIEHAVSRIRAALASRPAASGSAG